MICKHARDRQQRCIRWHLFTFRFVWTFAVDLHSNTISFIYPYKVQIWRKRLMHNASAGRDLFNFKFFLMFSVFTGKSIRISFNCHFGSNALLLFYRRFQFIYEEITSSDTRCESSLSIWANYFFRWLPDMACERECTHFEHHSATLLIKLFQCGNVVVRSACDTLHTSSHGEYSLCFQWNQRVSCSS